MFNQLKKLWAKVDGISLGSVFISDDARRMHTHIVGATGSGKTVCIEHLLFGDLKRGYGAVVIDPKGERDFYDRVKSFCKKIGREDDLHLISASNFGESSIWNPCGLGNVSELQTKFFNSAIYSEPHYAKACEAALLNAFNELTINYPNGFGIKELVDTLKNISTKTKEKNIEGLFYDLYNLSEGEWGAVLGSKESVQKEISILDVIQNKKILFIDLPTEGKLVQSSRIGRLITQEIILISGLKKRFPDLKSPKPYSVFIDEFDAFGTESFISFLNKGRSSGFLITIAHQTLSDLRKISPTFEGQVIGNTNVRFVFRQNDPKDCETWSKIFGTKKVTKQTYQAAGGMSTGATSNRIALEFKIHPDLIKDQLTGRCIFHVKSELKLKKAKIPCPLELIAEAVTQKGKIEFRSLKSESIATQEIEELVLNQNTSTRPDNSYSFLRNSKVPLILLIFLGGVLNGCAFKKSESVSEQLFSQTAGADNAKNQNISSEIIYSSEKSEARILTSKLDHFENTIPFVIPFPIPEKFLVKVTTISIKGIDYKVGAFLSINGFAPAIKVDLISKETIDNQTRWSFEVFRISEQFPFVEGQAFLLHFRLYTNEQSIHLELAARTAPKSLKVKESEILSANEVYDLGQRDQAKLVKEYEVTNTSDFSVQVELPYQIYGSVFRNFKKSIPIQTHCATRFDINSFKSVTHGKFILVPPDVVAGKFKDFSLKFDEPKFLLELKAKEKKNIYLILIQDYQLTPLFKQTGCHLNKNSYVTSCQLAECIEWKTNRECRESWKQDRLVCKDVHVCVKQREVANPSVEYSNDYELYSTGYEIQNPLNFAQIFYQDVPKSVTPVFSNLQKVKEIESLFGDFNNALPLDQIPEECEIY